MSKIEVNTIDTQCGSALQIGDGNTATIGLGKSGDTITVPSGATIVNSGTATGFGIDAVDWQTGSIKTGTFTAVAGEGYFVNTSGGISTVNLPAGVAGSIVALADYTRTWNSNNVTVTPNGSEKIGGGDAGGSATLSVDGQSATFVYVDGTEGWINIQETQTSQKGASALYVVATGGTPCTGAICGNFKTHVFTGPGTLVVSCAGNACGSNTVDYLVSAGGGGGGGNGAGGGGAGGFRLSNSVGCIAAPVMSPLASPTGITVSATPYAIAVGGGGPAGCGGTPGPACGVNGATSSFSTITSSGGGLGTGYAAPTGGPGGSGGGARGGPTPTSGYPGGAGNTPPFSPPQGTPGGAGYDGLSASTNGGGGGGAAVAGGNSAYATGGTGGAGSYLGNAFFGPLSPSYGTPGPVGSTKYFSGGGGGGTDSAPPVGTPGAGGDGGGGDGGQQYNAATVGTINTGGGGGGSGTSAPAGGAAGGAGGSGIVIIRYKFQ